MSSSPDSAALPSLVSVSKYLPFEGVRHAGGQYALQHYRALRDDYEIRVIAPDTRLNREAAETRPEVDFELLRGRSLLAKDGLKTLADLFSVAAGSSAHGWFRRALETDAQATSELSTARIVEFQWSEMASLSTSVRRVAPHAKTAVIAHDVISQRWQRAAEKAAGPVRRAAYAAAARASRKREGRSFADVDVVITFSDKDARLVRELAPSANPVVVHPGFPVPPERPPRAADRAPTILFTGAMNRPDNDHAAQWFVATVWPLVVAAVPDCRFVIAGASPSARLRAAAEASPGIEVTGAVESFDEVYEIADVCVVPLSNGAGVKFKTIEAMMRGIPTVATKVGAEGIDRADLLHAVVDDAGDFADAVVSALRGDGAAAAAREWAISVYGLDAFRSRLRGIYARLLSAREA